MRSGSFSCSLNQLAAIELNDLLPSKGSATGGRLQLDWVVLVLVRM